MEKIISINFHGRVIPIEEGAYNDLKKYIDSLRGHFASEEGSDDIIHDIENRIAELFSERIKRGASCIGNSDLDAVIGSIGRLEDIEAADGEEEREPGSGDYTPPNGQQRQRAKGRFFRSADDKVIAGVCSGIANQMGIDPVIIRILFVLLSGALFWIYILMWIIVPSQSISANVVRRLYRNPDDKMIAGVCGGLAVYFKTETWILRIIFAFPLILSIFSGGVHALWWHWPLGIGPRIFAGSIGSTLSIIYIVLWIALPYARSVTDMLEMRGEKIDMNSIKATTQANIASGNYPRRNGVGEIGSAIGLLFKVFFLFIAGIMALGLFGALIGLSFAGMAAAPFANFILDDLQQQVLLWAGVILFLGVPLLGLITWIVRRLMGVRSHRHYLGYIFGGLWTIGFICIMLLLARFSTNFSSKSMTEEPYAVQQPSTGKLYLNVSNNEMSGAGNNKHSRWFGEWDDDVPFYVIDKNQLWLNTVKINVTQSADSLFHIYEARLSRGSTAEEAKTFAGHISFAIAQQDSIINLPNGFAISVKDKFRNQQVMVMVEVPVGKKIQFNNNINDYDWFTMNVNGHRNVHFEREWNNGYRYRSNEEYLMTAAGLRNTQDTSDTREQVEMDN